MIAKRIKKEEYRDIKAYYDSRFQKLGIQFVMRFRAGYQKDSPLMECSVIVSKGTGVEEWGAIPEKEYYVLSIIQVKIIKE